MVKKLFEHFMKRVAKDNQTKFKIEKVINKKGDKLYIKWTNYISSGKVMIICIIDLICLRYHYYVISCYPEPSYIKRKIKVELDLSNYGTKYDAREATCVDKILKSEGYKLDIHELETVSTDLSRLSYIDNDVVYDCI